MARASQKLIDQVIVQIMRDIDNEDFTAISELLKYVPKENLIGYLPEEKQNAD